MNKEQQTLLLAYFDEEIRTCTQRKNALTLDNRKDEAAFEKIRANVYDIFRTILLTAVKLHGNDEKRIEAFYVQKMEQIPGNWVISYEKALQFGDDIKMLTEEIKLDTIRKIRVKSFQIMEGEQ